MTAVASVSPDIVAAHGLTAEEYQTVLTIMGRTPSLTELGIFSVMWSEHCSYKSSKKWLKTLPTKAPWVICGPGENAGVIDIGDGQALIFKIESHNHPSFIEPYQGAATGVGGIMRDVFTMGARPIANLNALRFGDPSHPKTRHLLSGVVAGIGGYGNCMGVPTVGGECEFHPAYNGNILVNAMTIGLADAKNIFYSAAAGVGNLIVYVGAKTGRDGIHGATMASAEFSDDSEAKRPTVQVGDPFTEKLLLEACLELMQQDAIIAIQDMGAAGLTSSSVEMASKGNVGIELDMDAVPLRERGMTAYEIMLSESQERMLMVLKPEKEALAKAIFAKWELDCAVIGRVTDTHHLIIKQNGQIMADIPVAPLVASAPEYSRPYIIPAPAPVLDAAPYQHVDVKASLLALLAHPNACSKRWIYEQYDQSVMGDTIHADAADAALIRLHGTRKAIAATTDCTPRYCHADPIQGGRQAVAESWRNVTATGCQPLAWTNNLNFGNPEKPAIMGQFVGCIQGMREAGEALDYPVISGNVSLYNETSSNAILPTPVIGGVGLTTNLNLTVGLGFRAAGDSVFLIGGDPSWLGASLYMSALHGLEHNAPPPVDFAVEKKHGDLVRQLIQQGDVRSCHDISSGGLLLAVAEAALAQGVGATLSLPVNAGFLYGEDQARYVVSTRSPDVVVAQCAQAGVPCRLLGTTGGAMLIINDVHIALTDLKAAHEGWLPRYMQGEAA